MSVFFSWQFCHENVFLISSYNAWCNFVCSFVMRTYSSRTTTFVTNMEGLSLLRYIYKNAFVQLVMTPMMRMMDTDNDDDEEDWWWGQSLCFQSIGSPEGRGGGKKKERKKGTRQKREEVLYKHLVDIPVVVINHKPGEILITMSFRMGIGGWEASGRGYNRLAVE